MNQLLKSKRIAPMINTVIMLAALFQMMGLAALSQATTGSIRGLVTDQTGAVVAGATVVAKNQATGVETGVFKSTGDGVYNVPNLIPGRYTLAVEAANFKRAVFTDIDVRLGQDITIDVSLQAGGAAETVTVVAGSETVIHRDTSQVSANIDARQVADLPSNVAGSGIDTLALLVPGVTPGFGNVNGNGTTLSVNGNRARSNNFSIDGQDNNDQSIGGPSFFVTNQDAVQDFQVITNNFSAQFGRNQGAIVNIVSRAGTNEFHGTGFWFHRDRKLFETLTNLERIATNPDGTRANPEAPPLLYNVFGGTVGGPIVKDKAFFFGSYQGIRTRETFIARSGALAILPEEFARLRSNLPGNPIAEALTSHSAFAITDFGTVRPRTDLADPFDSITIGGQTYQAAFPEREFRTSTATPTEQEEFTTRFDYKLSPKSDIWGRYLFQDFNFLNALGGSNGFTADLPGRSQNLGISFNRQLSSTAVNESRFSYSRGLFNFGGGCEGLTGCIPGPDQVGQAFTNLTFGSIVGNATGASLQGIGGGTGFPQGRLVETYQFADNVTMTRGKHQLIFGADVRRRLTDATFLPGFNGQFNVNSAVRLVNNSPFRVTLAVGDPSIAYGETAQFYFFQDDWKARDNLTLNLGLRYELIGQPINVLHELSVERESNPETALFRQDLPLESRTVPRVPADKNNWAPRIGFAYTPRFWKSVLGENDTVIRGGYSIAYDPSFDNVLLNVLGAAPFTFTNLTTTNPAVPPNPAAVTFPVPTGGLIGENVRSFAEARGAVKRNTFDPLLLANRTTVAPDFHNPYAQQWSLGFQRQIDRGNVVELRYLGTHGVGLFQTAAANPKIDTLLNGFTISTDPFGRRLPSPLSFPGFPGLVPSGVTPLTCVDNPATLENEGNCQGRLTRAGRETTRQNSAQSLYHSLQTRYNGRIFNQLSMTAAYTWSKGLDNASEIFGFQENSLAQNPFNITGLERSYSGFDRRHALSLSGIWDIPAFKDQKGARGRLLGGWQLNSVYVLSSGLRFTPVQGGGLNIFVPSYVDPLGADILKPFVGNSSADPRTVAISQVDAHIFSGFFPFAAFIPIQDPNGFYLLNDLNNGKITPVSRDDVRFIFNGPGAAKIFNNPYGNVARNSEVGPKLNQVNFGMFKNTRINERVRLQFRTEIFNLFNHPNPGFGLASAVGGAVPNIVIESAGITGGAFNEDKDLEYGRRVIQFGMKVIF